MYFIGSASHTPPAVVNHVFYPEHCEPLPPPEEEYLPPSPVQTFHIHNEMPEYPQPPLVDDAPVPIYQQPPPLPPRSTAPIRKSGTLAAQQRYRQTGPPIPRRTSSNAPSRQYPNGLEENYNVVTPGKTYFDPARTVASTQQLPSTQQTGMFVDPRTGQLVRGTLTTQGGQVSHVVNGAPYQVRPPQGYAPMYGRAPR